jgi:hypothetical protein
MAQEVSSCLKLPKDDGINELMKFSPFEMRNLLHHLMAGFEFQIERKKDGAYCVVIEDKVISKVGGQSDAISETNVFQNVRGQMATLLS